MLEVNGAALSTLAYLDPKFKITDEDPAFFDATVRINNNIEVTRGGFEWRAGTLGHKIAVKA